MTQGSSLEDLKEHLLDLYQDLSSDVISNVRVTAPSWSWREAE